MTALKAALAFTCSLFAACAAPASAPPAAAPTTASAPPPPPTPATVAATPAPSPPPAPPKSTPEPGRPCGGLGCRAFSSPEAAFEVVLQSAPRVLALGEAHAQKGSERIPSSTRRFTESLLPMLQGKADALVLELWVADGKCGKTEREVAKRQAPVTETQAQSNQSEFVALGHRAKALGVMPSALTPTCEQYEKIAGAGADDIAEMLRMIADATLLEIQKLLNRPGSEKMIVAYGGAMHNDLSPRPGREAWSFGPKLFELTQGRYVELDLIVPEYVKDNEVWQSLPWYPHFDRERHGAETLLYNPGPGSYVLIFPKTELGATESPAPQAP